MGKKGFLQSVWNTVVYNSEESRSLENPNIPITNDSVIQIIGGSGTKSGTPIDGNTSLAVSAYTRANQILSDVIGTLPLNVHKKNTDGSTEIIDHPVADLLKLEPNELQTAVNWKGAGQGQLNTYGNFFAEIIRKTDGTVRSLGVPFPSPSVSIKTNGGRLVYEVETNGANRIILAKDMFHVAGFSYDGLMGIAKLDLMRESLGLAKTYEDKASYFVKNDSTPPIAIINKGSYNETQNNSNKKNWQAAQAGANSGKAAHLSGDFEIKQLAITPDQAQFLESRVFSVGEIARFTGVPPHLLFELDRATFNNIEQQNIEFATYTIDGWVTKWEQEINRKLFRPSEKKKVYAKFNLNGLMKADAKSRGEFYKALSGIGAITPNQIAKLEDMNPLEGGDRSFRQMQDIPLDRVDDYLDSIVAKSAVVEPKKEEETETEEDENEK